MWRRVFSSNKNATGTVIRFLFTGTQKASPHNEVIQPFQIIFWGMVKLNAERGGAGKGRDGQTLQEGFLTLCMYSRCQGTDLKNPAFKSSVMLSCQVVWILSLLSNNGGLQCSLLSNNGGLQCSLLSNNGGLQCSLLSVKVISFLSDSTENGDCQAFKFLALKQIKVNFLFKQISLNLPSCRLSSSHLYCWSSIALICPHADCLHPICTAGVQ